MKHIKDNNAIGVIRKLFKKSSFKKMTTWHEWKINIFGK